MSKYSEKVARRLAAPDAAPDAPATPPSLPKPAAPRQRGTLVDLGALPANCAAAYEEAAAALERASAIARTMLERCARSCQSGEATSAALLAETTAPRLRAAATRLRHLPAAPRN